LTDNFGSRYVKKSIKGSKDADHSLVSKQNLNQKMSHWIGAHGRVKVAKKRKNTPIVTSHQRCLNPKRKKNFSISTTRLAESVEEGLNSSITQSAGELMRCKAVQNKWRTQDVKGGANK